MNTQDRATKIGRILETHYEAADLSASLRDLLADARHFADRQGLSFGEEDRIAHDNYSAEAVGERRGCCRPGDAAWILHEETGISYERCLVMTNTD